jgi:hypothetical protein
MAFDTEGTAQVTSLLGACSCRKKILTTQSSTSAEPPLAYKPPTASTNAERATPIKMIIFLSMRGQPGQFSQN